MFCKMTVVVLFVIKSVVVRRGRPSKKRLATAAADVTEEECSHEQDTTSAEDNTVADEQARVDCSEPVSSEISNNVSHVLVETAAVDCDDVADIPDGAVAISSLENGTFYVLQRLDSAVDVQNIDCRTLRLLGRADGDGDEASSAVPTVLVAASSADVISGPANLAHFLRSAVITDVKPEPVSQSASAT